jgi:hypothetical protein
MKLSPKISLIYVPVLIISIAFIAGYSFLNWGLFITNGLFNLKEEFANIMLPIFLPWVPILLWIRPKMTLLDLKTQKGSLLPVYLMVSWLALTAPTLIAQSYLLTATGKLTALNTIGDIKQRQPTKFYTLTSHYIDKSGLSVWYAYSISGKSGQYRDRTINIVCPIYDSGMAIVQIGILPGIAANPGAIKPKRKVYIINGIYSDSLQASLLPKDSIYSRKTLRGPLALNRFGEAGAGGAVIIKTKGYSTKPIAPPLAGKPKKIAVAWLGMKYHEQVSNRASAEELNASSKAFYDSSLQQFHDTNLEAFKYLDRIGNNDDRERYIKAINKIQPVTGAPMPIILEPKFGEFAERNGNKLEWFFGSFCIGSLVTLIMVLIPKLKEPVQE